MAIGEKGNGYDMLTWDGNTEGLEASSGVYFKVSDLVITQEDLANGICYTLSTGERGFVSADKLSNTNGMLLYTYFRFVYAEGAPFSTGVYLFNNASQGYVTSLTIHGYTGFPQ